MAKSFQYIHQKGHVVKKVLMSLLLAISYAQLACGMVRTTATLGAATGQVTVPALYYAIKQRSYYQGNQQQTSERVHTARVDEYDYKYERHIYEYEPCNNFVNGTIISATPVVNFFPPLIAIYEAAATTCSKIDDWLHNKTPEKKIRSENELINDRAFTHGIVSGLSLYATVPLAIYYLKKPEKLQQAVVAFKPVLQVIKENNSRLVTVVKEIGQSKVKNP